MKPPFDTHPTNILLIVGGSIAAYKALDMIRLLQADHCNVTAILTQGAQHFITPLAVSSLTGNPTYTELFSLREETEMGHIRLAREADIVLVAPATAHMLAKMAHGLADDLASTVLLACNPTETPIWVAPAMNHHMWHHPATRRNITSIQQDGIQLIPPAPGTLACGETGDGKLADIEHITSTLLQPRQALLGKHVLITGGGTREILDPVRYIGNHSSGKQAVALANKAAYYGANVTLVHAHMQSDIMVHPQVKKVPAMQAQHMLDAVEEALPADIAICAAAIADWYLPSPPASKQKKTHRDTWQLTLHKTPDILQHIATHPRHRPNLVIGFAAETDRLIEHATQKRISKQCDWILANDVSDGQVFGHDETTLHCITGEATYKWHGTKEQVAKMICDTIIVHTSPT